MRGIHEIAKSMATQDNQATEHPLFVVERKRTVYGMDLAYSDEWAWGDSDGEVDETIEGLLNALLNSDGDIPKKYRRVGVAHHWEFVTCCLTEDGANAYLEANGHNLGETRVCVRSAWRNEEMQAVQSLVSEQADRQVPEAAWNN